MNDDKLMSVLLGMPQIPDMLWELLSVGQANEFVRIKKILEESQQLEPGQIAEATIYLLRACNASFVQAPAKPYEPNPVIFDLHMIKWPGPMDFVTPETRDKCVNCGNQEAHATHYHKFTGSGRMSGDCVCGLHADAACHQNPPAMERGLRSSKG